MLTRTQLHAQPVVIVGSVAYDTIETPQTKGEHLLGGAASYAAIAAGYFTKARLVGIVGRDFELADLAKFEQNNVDTAGLVHDNSGDTFSWHGRYADDRNHRETIATNLNVFEHFDPRVPADWQDSHFVLLANIHPAQQAATLAQMKNRPFAVMDTMNLWLDIARAEVESLIDKVNLLIINDEEAEQMSGLHSVIKNGKAILKNHPNLPFLIIKRGEHGATFFSRGNKKFGGETSSSPVTPHGNENCGNDKIELFVFPAFPVENVLDTTGAGDSFAGALTGFLATKTGAITSREIRQGIVYATVFSSFAIETFSTTGIEKLSRERILSRCNLLAKITEV